MNEVERGKETYKTSVKQLSKLSPDMTQGFPDEPGLEILGRGPEQGETEEAIPHALPEKKSGSGHNKRMRGLGRVFQPTYKDKKTNEKKQAATWWVQYSYRGKVKREPSGSLHRTDATVGGDRQGSAHRSRRRENNLRGSGRDDPERLSGQRAQVAQPG